MTGYLIGVRDLGLDMLVNLKMKAKICFLIIFYTGCMANIDY